MFLGNYIFFCYKLLQNIKISIKCNDTNGFKNVTKCNKIKTLLQNVDFCYILLHKLCNKIFDCYILLQRITN